MAVAVLEAEPKRATVRKSTKQNRRRRRMRCLARAEKTRREDLIRGNKPTIFGTTDYELMRACGWDARAREMRVTEPPTRMRAYPQPPEKLADQKKFPPVEPCRDLNKPNGWHVPNDMRGLVQPTEGAAWLWWLSLGDDAQDELADLSAKCSSVARDGGGCSDEPDPLEMLAERRMVAVEGEDPKAWGRLK